MARKTAVTSRKLPTQERSKQTVEAIVVATSHILVREGYEGTTTTRVAELAGVSIGSLYQYFPTKEALVAAVVDRHIIAMLSLLAEKTATLQEEPLEEAVQILVRAVMLAHAVNPELHDVLTRNFHRVGGFLKVQVLNVQSRAVVVDFLEKRRQFVRPKNLELAAFILVHSVQAVVSAAVVDRSLRLDDEVIVLELTMLVLGYLGATSGSPVKGGENMART